MGAKLINNFERTYYFCFFILRCSTNTYFKCKCIIIVFLLKLAKKDMRIKKIYYICDVIKMLREENKLLDL